PQRPGRRPAAVGRVGQPRDKGLPEDMEADVAIAQYLEEGLTEPLIELRQRVEVVPELIRLAADLNGHIAPMFVSHSIPPSNDGGGVIAAPLRRHRRLFPRRLERHAEDKAALKLRRDLRVHDHSLELLGLSERGMIDLE